MLHEHLQADVVREDSLPIIGSRTGTVHARGHVCRRRVQFRQKETGLTSTLITNDITWNRLPVRQKVLQISRLDYNKSRVESDKPERRRRELQATP